MENPASEKTLNFGEYAIVEPIEHYFEKMPDTFWRIKPVTSGAEVARSRFLLHNRSVTSDGIRYEQPPTALEICHREIALLFGGTNLSYTDDEPALRDNATVQEIEFVLGKMPPEMVDEVWTEIGKQFPKWGPAPKEELEAMMMMG